MDEANEIRRKRLEKMQGGLTTSLSPGITPIPVVTKQAVKIVPSTLTAQPTSNTLSIKSPLEQQALLFARFSDAEFQSNTLHQCLGVTLDVLICLDFR